MLGALSLSLLLSGIQLSQAVNVYLSPPTNFVTWNLSPKEASFTLSRHLGLDFFESLADSSGASYGEEPFVGQGSVNSLLLTLDEVDAKAVLPPSLRRAFTLSTSYAPISSLSSVVSTYLHRATHSYSSVYTSSSHSAISLSDPPAGKYLDNVFSLSSFFDSTDQPAFAAMELTGLSQLRLVFGPTSQEYNLAVNATRTLLQNVVAESDKLHLALLTFTPSIHSNSKRQPNPQQSQSPLPPNHPPPQEPIGSVSTCFSTADACSNQTNACSGRGECVEASKAGRTCFVCACGVTKTGNGSQVKTEVWVGESCERKDVSGPFVLLTGTVIVMILLIAGSVSLLYGIGDQELPSTLMGGAVPVKRE